MLDSLHIEGMPGYARAAAHGAYPNQLRAWRRLRGFSQRQLSIASGIAESTLSLLESGRTGFTRVTLQKIGDALDVPIGYLLSVQPPEAEIRALVEAAAALPEPRRTRIIEIIQRLVEPETAAEPASPPKGQRRSA